MRTLVLAPELHRSQGGIPRILRLYVRALQELDAAGPVDVVVLNDRPEDDRAKAETRNLKAEDSRAAAAGVGQLASDAPPQVSGFESQVSAFIVGCARSKGRFLRHTFRLGWSADRIVCGHVHLLPVAWALSKLRPRLKYFLVAHGIEVWRPFSALERRALRGAERILCVSDFTRRELRKHAPDLDEARLVVVPNAVDPGFFAAAPSAKGGGQSEVPASPPRELSTGNPPVSAGHPRILVVSRLTSVDREKGVEDLIRAMPLVRRKYPHAQLRIVGGGDDAARLAQVAEGLGLGAPPKPETRNLKPESGSNPQLSSETLLPQVSGLKSQVSPSAVSFTGTVDDEQLRTEYSACDLFALPSKKEGFGLVYLEAMAFGRPCLAANAGGAPEVVGADDPKPDGSNPQLSAFNLQLSAFGVLVPYGDLDAIAAAVDDLVARPRDPAAIRARAESFGYGNFRSRLQEALSAGARNPLPG